MRNNQNGSINVLVVSLVLTAILLIAALGFGTWAFMGRQDYKDNVDQKIAAAQEVTKQQTETAKDNEFQEKEKQPLKQYKSSTELSSISMSYPKTWSAYIDEKGTGSSPLSGYFHPKYVPAVNNTVSYALRVELSNRTLVDEAKPFDSYIKQGKVTSQPYQSIVQGSGLGVKFEGEIFPKKQGVLVLLPIREKTLKIWTESSTEYKGDLENIILKNISYSP